MALHCLKANETGQLFIAQLVHFALNRKHYVLARVLHFTPAIGYIYIYIYASERAQPPKVTLVSFPAVGCQDSPTSHPQAPELGKPSGAISSREAFS